MPRKILWSATHAARGLRFACHTERNLQLFLLAYIPAFIVAATFFTLDRFELLWLITTGGAFLSIELINTSLERLADAVDDHCKSAHQSHCFAAVKHAKDIAASASLMSLTVTIITFITILLPHVIPALL